jgi:hypothetical protein
MKQRAFKNVNNCLNTNIYSYLGTSGGQSLTPVLIRHLWQLKTFVFLHWCIVCAVLLKEVRSTCTFKREYLD